MISIVIEEPFLNTYQYLIFIESILFKLEQFLTKCKSIIYLKSNIVK